MAFRPSARRAIPVVLSVVLAIWAEWALFTEKLIVDGILLFAGSLALFVLFVLPGHQLVRSPIAPTVVPKMAAKRRSGVYFALIAASVLLTWLFSSGNRFRPETILSWLLSTALYLMVFWERGPSSSVDIVERFKSIARRDISVPWSVVGLGLVMLVGAFFRYYQINTVPAEPTSDIAEKLFDIRDVLNGQYRIFFPRNTGREPLEFYMAIPFVQAFGLSHLALKALTATVSLLSIPLVFLIGREIVDSRFGLLAAFFLAISKWDVGIGRVGLRYPYYPLFTAIAFFFLLRAARSGQRNDYLLCGLATGIGLYGYIPFRAMVLLISVVVAIRVATQLRRSWTAALATLKNTALCFGLVAVVFVPLLHYMWEDPEMFWVRALTRVSGLETPLPSHPVLVFLSNVVNALLMFNWRGDVVWVATKSLDPVLDYVSGGLFLMGVAWCVVEVVKRREVVAAYLLAALVVLILPSTLSIAFPSENPSVVRAGGADIVVAILVAVPVYLAAKSLWREGLGGARLTLMGVLVAVVLLLAAKVNFDRYFVDYALQYRQSSINSSEIAAVINGFSHSVGSRQNAYLKAWPYWVDGRNVAFWLGDPSWGNFLMTTDDILRQQPPAGNKLYIINAADQDAVRVLRQRFPDGQLRVEKSATPGQDFLAFFAPASP